LSNGLTNGTQRTEVTRQLLRDGHDVTSSNGGLM
jgi:hypothetical protein